MKKILFSLALLLLAGGAIAQNSIRNENLPEFTGITLSGNMNVELIASSTNAIDVQLYESDVKRFTWSLNSNGVLSVTLRPTVGQKSRADVRIYYKATLHNVTVSDARLTAAADIASSIFRLSVSGGGNASIAVDADDFEVEATANSAVVVSGTAKYLSVRATERSKVDTRGLKAVAAEVEAVTGAEIYVFASERIVTNARNASTIYYAGNPTIVKDRTSKSSIGSGVHNIDPKQQ